MIFFAIKEINSMAINLFLMLYQKGKTIVHDKKFQGFKNDVLYLSLVM